MSNFRGHQFDVRGEQNRHYVYALMITTTKQQINRVKPTPAPPWVHNFNFGWCFYIIFRILYTHCCWADVTVSWGPHQICFFTIYHTKIETESPKESNEGDRRRLHRCYYPVDPFPRVQIHTYTWVIVGWWALQIFSIVSCSRGVWLAETYNRGVWLAETYNHDVWLAEASEHHPPTNLRNPPLKKNSRVFDFTIPFLAGLNIHNNVLSCHFYSSIFRVVFLSSSSSAFSKGFSQFSKRLCYWWNSRIVHNTRDFVRRS